VAGSLAINLVSNTTQALIQPGATVDAGGGDVVISAANDAAETASALPAEGSETSSGKVGIGASLALSIATNTTQAEHGNAGQLAGANDLTLSAESDDTTAVEATAGAKGGIAVSPAVALAIANNTTTARLGTGSTLDLGGALSATATHAGSTTTKGG